MRFSLGLPVCFFFFSSTLGGAFCKAWIWPQKNHTHKKKMDHENLFFNNNLLLKKKTFDTQDSRVVPHRSTDWAQPCLTSQFGWDTVYPQWYDRMMRYIILSSILLCTDQRTVMKPMFQLSHYEQVRVGVVGNISACHADAPGSIPGHGVSNFFFPSARVFA